MPDCFIAMDAGTTNSRAWIVEGGVIRASGAVPVGVRDTARDGHSGRLWAGLRELVASVRSPSRSEPTLIAAAGMLTSSLGVREVAHQLAPVGAIELAAGSVECSLPEISDLPLILFPGVRSGAWFSDEDVESTDLMRGEETLCLGLASQRPGQPLTVLNLGSHWKAIHVDSAGRITGSWTTLSGEVLHAVMTQTILASAVPEGRPAVLDEEWCSRGGEMFSRYGFSRTLFTVRLWEVQTAAQVSAEQRLAFLVGALIAEGLDGFRRAGYLTGGVIQLVGSGGIADAWQSVLERSGLLVERIDEEGTTRAFVSGIGHLLSTRG